MNTYALRYGQTQLNLAESKTLIGVRPQRNQEVGLLKAIGQTLGDNSWKEAGLIGGFKIISIDESKVDAGKLLDQLRLDSSVAVGTHVFELPEGRGLYVPTGDLYLEFKPDVSIAERNALIEKFKLQIKEARGADGLIAAVTRDSLNPIKVAVALQQDKGILIAEPDLASKILAKGVALPTDSLISDQWHLRNVGHHRGTSVGFLQGADARIVDAWKIARTAGQPNTVVAVIDDGFDLSHPDFSTPGKVVHPWDFTRRSPDPRPDFGDWHGTACAGVAVATGGAGSVIGAAPGCSLMPVRWGPDLSDAQIEAWFNYVTTKGASVVSCSWGAANPHFPLSTRASRAIQKCASEGRDGKGCIIVFAAGNSNHDINNPGAGTVDGFAIHPDVIAVAASTSQDARSNYSNFGREVSICAPSSGSGGWGILTSDVTGFDPNTGIARGYADGDYTYDFGGTSSACPLVAGVAALLLSVNPNLSRQQLKDVIQKTARKIGNPALYDATGHSAEFGYGCIDSFRAVRAVLQDAQPSIAARQALHPVPHIGRRGLPPANAIIQSRSLVPSRPLRADAAARVARTYTILRTNEVDLYDRPLSAAEISTTGAARFAGQGDDFRGKSRKAAKISITNAEVENFANLKSMIDSLAPDADMIDHDPHISTDQNSKRVTEEKRNVRLNAFLYAASREDDNDFHLIIGQDLAAPDEIYMTVELSGLPPPSAASFARLRKVREAFKEYFQDNLPNASYDYYDPPIPIEIEGSLFFDMSHASGSKPGPGSLRELIPTIWEIHPITELAFEP